MSQDNILIGKKRLEIYEFLSYGFLNLPSKDLLLTIERESEFLGELGDDDISFLHEKTLEELEQEYYDRFFVPTSSLFLPPYESSIRNKKQAKGKTIYGPVDGKESFHVKACYELVDFKIDQLNAFGPLKDGHYPDHIAFELAFMSYMVNLEVKSLEVKDEVRGEKWKKLQRDFLRDHISKWISDYARLANEKGGGLYAYLSNIAASWIDLDLRELMEELE